MLPVEHVRRVQPDLKVGPASQRKRSRDIAVQQQRLIPSKPIDPQREQSLLEVGRHSRELRSKPASTSNQRSSVGSSRAISSIVAIEEDVPELQQRTGLPFERMTGLPSPENHAEHAAIVQKRASSPKGSSKTVPAVTRCGRAFWLVTHCVGA